jgi:hypothetical protein
VQIPISTQTSSTLPEAIASDPRVSRVTRSLGSRPLPTIDLLRIGWMF